MGWQNTILYIRVSLHLNRNSTFKNSLCVLISFKIPKALLDFTFTQILPLETTSLEFSFYTFMTFSFLYLGPGVSQFLTLIVFSNGFFFLLRKKAFIYSIESEAESKTWRKIENMCLCVFIIRKLSSSFLSQISSFFFSPIYIFPTDSFFFHKIIFWRYEFLLFHSEWAIKLHLDRNWRLMIWFLLVQEVRGVGRACPPCQGMIPDGRSYPSQI